MTYHRLCNRSNTQGGTTSGAGTAYPSGASEFTPRILMGFVLLNLQFSVFVICPFSFGHCIVCIFKLFLHDRPLYWFKVMMRSSKFYLQVSKMLTHTSGLRNQRLSGLSLCRSPFHSALRKLYTEPSYQILVHFGYWVSEEKIVWKSTNQKKELHIDGSHVC